MAASGYTPIQLYYSTTASAIPTAGNLANGELAINITDGKIYYKNNSGVVTLFGSTGDVSTISFGTTGLTPSTATGGAVTVAGTLVAANGGTGQSSYTTGDLIYASGSTALSKLAIGTNGYVLQSNGTAPAWVAASSVVGGAAGSNTQIQYNNSGALGASSDFVFDGTNVGIGISSPSSPLSFASATGQKIRLYNSLSGYGIGVESSEFRFVTDSSSKFTWLNGTYSGGTTYMTLDANGRLLIGNTTNNTSFGGLLQVEGTDKAFANIVRYSSNAAGAPAFYLARSKSATLGTNTIVASGDTLGTILFAGANGTTYSDAAYIQAAVDGTPGASADMPGRLMFFTSADGSATPTERMRIDSSGNVGIGATPTARLTVDSGSTGLMMTLNSTAANGGYLTGYSSGTAVWDLGTAKTTVNTGGASDVGLNTRSGFLAFGTGTTERMRLDTSGNLGLGVTPSAWSSSWKAFQFGSLGAAFGNTGNAIWSANEYLNAAGTPTYITSQYAVRYRQDATTGSHAWLYAASGTAGNAITFTQAMTLDAGGRLLIGKTSTDVNNFGIQVYQSANTYGSSIQLTWAGVGAAGIWENSSGALVFGNDNSSGTTERMRIDSSGNVLFAKAVRATITTDNDLSFDMNAASNFKCTPTAGGALTFTNITSGQSGNILLVNGSNYAITAAATTKVSSTCLATISATGTYWLSYYSDGTNVYVANTGALA